MGGALDLALRIATPVIASAGLLMTAFLTWQQRKWQSELASKTEVRKQVASAKVSALLKLHEYSFSDDEVPTSQNPVILDDADAVNWGLQLHDLRRSCMPFLTRKESDGLFERCEALSNALYESPMIRSRIIEQRHALTDFIRQLLEVEPPRTSDTSFAPVLRVSCTPS